MTHKLGRNSRAQMAGLHPDLIRVLERGIEISEQDFGVHDGVRQLAEQQVLFDKGATRTMKSRHLVQADGFGHAADCPPWINGRLRWEWGPLYVIASALRRASIELGVEMVWGGVWDRVLSSPDFGDGSPAAMKRAVEAYCLRHPGPDFIDGPHFELGAKYRRAA